VSALPAAGFSGGNRVRLLTGGDELFPAVCAALDAARHEVLFASYIFSDDGAGRCVADALIAAAARGVRVRVVLDGFGGMGTLPVLRGWFQGSAVQLEVFRPIDRWWNWLQPSQLRRLHHKLCVVDGSTAFVGGINVIDDRFDQRHGWSDAPRLDFAVEVRGPVAGDVEHLAQALWTRAHLGHGWRGEVSQLARSAEPISSTLRLLRDLSSGQGAPADDEAQLPLAPVRAALVVRDNLRQRRAIERAYVGAIGSARERIDIACPYFYPGRGFRRALRRAAARGVRIRLLLQGKADYRFAALAAQVLYDELLGRGVRVFEYTPAFLHAKVALVDREWATVGSSNIDPLSLLLNLEANVVVVDGAFAADLAARLDTAFAASAEITAPPVRPGVRGLMSRGLVAWVAAVYLRVAGITGRY